MSGFAQEPSVNFKDNACSALTNTVWAKPTAFEMRAVFLASQHVLKQELGSWLNIKNPSENS